MCCIPENDFSSIFGISQIRAILICPTSDGKTLLYNFELFIWYINTNKKISYSLMNMSLSIQSEYKLDKKLKQT